MRKTALAFAPMIVVLALAGCTPAPPAPDDSGSSAASDSASPSAEALAPCADGTIEVAINEAEGSAGHWNYQIAFTNTGADCTLDGYPKVSVVGNGNGTQFGVNAEEITDTPASEVTVAAGATVYAYLRAVNIDSGGGPLGEDCRVNTGDGYNVVLPGSFESIFVASPGVAACTSGVPWMEVGPISLTA